MSSFSVIIPSRSVTNLRACVAAMRAAGETCRIIVVDDGVEVPIDLPPTWLADVGMLVKGVKPFVFSRNVNLGIIAAGDDDVILLNDDALLETPGGFTAMQRAAYDHMGCGLISASTNLAGNPDQHRRGLSATRLLGCTPGNSFPTVAFVCVYLPRATIDVIGLLDERFAPGMYEDNDYCRRINLAGMRIAVCDGCFVDHSRLKPSFRSSPTAGADLETARKIYLDKWGSA